MEHCAQFWSHYRKYASALGRYQRRLGRCLDWSIDEERLDRSGLFSLEQRMLRGLPLVANKMVLDWVDS